MAKKAVPKVANTRSLVKEFEDKAVELAPPKWTTLEAARSYVADYLMGQTAATEAERQETHCLETGTKPNTDFGRRYWEADISARQLLVGLLADGELPARGILASINSSELVMLEPLPVIWWHHILDIDQYKYFGFRVTNAIPLHALSWTRSRIKRVVPAEANATLKVVDKEIHINANPTTGTQFNISEAMPSATVTEVRIDRLKLLKILPPVGRGDTNSAAAHEPSKRGRRPDFGRIAEVQRLAKQVIKKKFGTVDAFNKEVANRFSMGKEGEDGLDAKQVGRWIFGDP